MTKEEHKLSNKYKVDEIDIPCIDPDIYDGLGEKRQNKLKQTSYD
ncbi:hypothetical protein GCM10023143_18080 [Compostibacter hankyongensis]|uniref:Uncharacterized protein n=1 Tax=Compostibacter hankyongensis TaxID=1007089 RepID=A0ABP8FS80_9BACT